MCRGISSQKGQIINVAAITEERRSSAPQAPEYSQGGVKQGQGGNEDGEQRHSQTRGARVVEIQGEECEREAQERAAAVPQEDLGWREIEDDEAGASAQ